MITRRKFLGLGSLAAIGATFRGCGVPLDTIGTGELEQLMPNGFQEEGEPSEPETFEATLKATQSAFVSDLERDLISAQTHPDILRLTEGSSKKTYPTEAVLLQFDLRPYSNHTIDSAVLRLHFVTGLDLVDNPLDFTVSPNNIPWSTNTLSYRKLEEEGFKKWGGDYTPGGVYLGEMRDGIVDTDITNLTEYLAKNPGENHGIVLYPWERSGDLVSATFHSHRTSHPPTLEIKGRKIHSL
ncbi:MAG: DNRLRE domain-containing protein [Nanoarchaeota archaeon]|nr:DNRLRE domain-containing protein [Nanoarchaeota archaeon]MBU1103185.1 DNRLRE domain-containing protein [Nanoarchaeota archaeon]